MKKLHKTNFHTKTSLKNIQEKKNIIWKDANRRSTGVIVDKTYYRTKIEEKLRDETNLKLIDTNLDNDVILKLTKFCKTLNETLNRKRKDFLFNYIPKTSNFYGLTIHKSKEIKISVEREKNWIHKNSKPH